MKPFFFSMTFMQKFTNARHGSLKNQTRPFLIKYIGYFASSVSPLSDRFALEQTPLFPPIRALLPNQSAQSQSPPLRMNFTPHSSPRLQSKEKETTFSLLGLIPPSINPLARVWAIHYYWCFGPPRREGDARAKTSKGAVNVPKFLVLIHGGN